MQKAAQKISTCLWFDGQAEEAAKFYVSVFRNSKVKQTVLYGDAGPGPKGSVMTVHFELDGREFLALNAGPMFKFNHAISLMVNCETQKELDEMWDKLSAGGAAEQCGWLRDKFGLSWQIVPAVLPQLLSDPATSDKVMQAVLKMIKLDIVTMQKAAA
jgi:predicted 3-demethylubiquinone-9 3-methyltransferase (glyoxalase superfamily)